MKTSQKLAASVAPDEIVHFSNHADDWWTPDGIFSSLHDLTRPRVQYIKQQCRAAFGTKKSFESLTVLDMGCGGGLISEALTRQGAQIVGVDASDAAIKVAKNHAQESNLSIDYQVGTAESLAQRGDSFDVVLALDVVEHVADLSSFLDASSKLLNKNGIIIISTLNRTHASFLFSIVGAEYIMGKVPLGTHDYEKFIKPHELTALCEVAELQPTDIKGLVYRPFRRVFELEAGKNSINYFLTACRA